MTRFTPARTTPVLDHNDRWIDESTGEAAPEPCCGLLTQVAVESDIGWRLVATADAISYCPFCGATLINGPPRDEPGLPLPTREIREQGRAAYRALADYQRHIARLLDALEERRRRGLRR